MSNQTKAKEINTLLEGANAEDIVGYFLDHYKDKVVFTSSLGAEDQVITHFIAEKDKSTRIATLDTGRLFPETYDLIDKTNEFFGISMDIYFPDFKKVEEMVKERGVNLFYKSIEDRKRCCFVRKIESLERAVRDMDVWITGLRREQSITRTDMKVVEWDEAHELLKVNPLVEWTDKQVWDHIKDNNLPYNKLHDQNYPSIGCEPCTRAIKPGEDVRAGRWWWEQPDKKECGLHTRSSNK